MVHTENQLIHATVLKVQKFLQKIHRKEIITEEQFKEVKQIISSLRVHSDVNIPIADNSPNPQPLYKSIQNLYEPESIKSSTHKPKLLKPSLNEPKASYAAVNKPLINKRNGRVQLNCETFQQKVRNEIEGSQASLDSCTVMPPKICRAKLYSTPKVEKVQLTKTNVESFKNYINSNNFNSLLNDDALIMQCHDALDLTRKKNFYNKDLMQEERFVVNMFESRPSKRWQKKDALIDLRNNLGIYDNNFISITGASVNDNQSANNDFGVCNNNNAASDGKSECSENYYSTLSARQGVDSTISTINIENDIYHTIQDLESTCNQQQEGVNTNNNNNKLTSTNNFYYTMADEPLYYNVTLDQELEEIKSTLGNNEAEFFRLKQEADVQCNVMKQAYKAIEACRSTKRFCNSTEKVMAEKILLLASTRYANLIQTIRESQYDNILLTPKKSSCVLKICNQPRISKTTISNISLPLNNAWLFSSHNNAKHLNWFLVVASGGNKILASETVLLKPGEKHIEVKQLFEFERLDAGFMVEVSVYHMRLTSDEGRQFEFGFNKRVSTLCRSFRKLHYKDLQTQTLVSNRIPSSGFTKCGSIMITIHDLLSNRVNWKLTLHNPQHTSTNNKSRTVTSSVGHNNYMYGRQGSILNKVEEYIIPIEDTFSMDVNIQKAALLINRSGFLTVGTKSARDTISWNRRYCVLNDTNLHFYNDPLEADFYKDCGITISLKNSLTTYIDVATPSVCPKPKTLMLDTISTEDNKSRLRHFLKADSTQEMEAWRSDFNTIIVLLKNWNELNMFQAGL